MNTRFRFGLVLAIFAAIVAFGLGSSTADAAVTSLAPISATETSEETESTCGTYITTDRYLYWMPVYNSVGELLGWDVVAVQSYYIWDADWSICNVQTKRFSKGFVPNTTG